MKKMIQRSLLLSWFSLIFSWPRRSERERRQFVVYLVAHGIESYTGVNNLVNPLGITVCWRNCEKNLYYTTLLVHVTQLCVSNWQFRDHSVARCTVPKQTSTRALSSKHWLLTEGNCWEEAIGNRGEGGDSRVAVLHMRWPKNYVPFGSLCSCAYLMFYIIFDVLILWTTWFLCFAFV